MTYAINFTLLFMLFIFSGCGKDEKSCYTPPLNQAHWENRMGKYADNLIKIRINKSLKKIAGKSCYNFQIAAGVQIKNPKENGMPREQEREILEKVEDVLVQQLTASGTAVYAARIFIDKRCDYIFYGKKKKIIIKAVQAIGDTIENYPVEITVKPDKKWVTYNWFATFGIHNPYD
ncbi:MAG: DUF695 domain-containing protein [Fibrobacter sp.]|nr:DUF695 domain-containing protein [Fibrobacter sp.]